MSDNSQGQRPLPRSIQITLAALSDQEGRPHISVESLSRMREYAQGFLSTGELAEPVHAVLLALSDAAERSIDEHASWAQRFLDNLNEVLAAGPAQRTPLRAVPPAPPSDTPEGDYVELNEHE